MIDEQKVEIDFLKKVQAYIRLRSNLVEPAYMVLSISRQCKLLWISRSQDYFEPSSKQDEKDFNLLVKIKSRRSKLSIRIAVTAEFGEK